MRKVAGYSFEQTPSTTQEGQAQLASSCAAVEAWVKDKGTLDAETGVFTFRDGRTGQYARTELLVDGARLVEHVLQEVTDGGPIQTDIKIGLVGNKVLAYVELRAGAPQNWVGPLSLDIRCPRVVRTILDGSRGWKLGETPLGTKPVRFRGAADADRLEAAIWHADRNLPVVCISEDDEGPLTDDLAEQMAADLSGLAIVAHIDSVVSWTITKLRGREWSCFNGAIRLYWPRVAATSDPLHHPLWTKYSLLRDAGTASDASRKIRQQLRRRILGLSAFSVTEPLELRQIREKSASLEADRERATLQSNAEWEKLADSYSKENDALKERLNAAESEINDLRVQLTNLQGVLQWKETSESEVAPQRELPPTTVSEAVDRARRCFPRLYFGDDVDRSVSTLSRDAGPPDKILDYFGVLQEMAEAHSRGPLGVTQLQWLNDRGVHASGESETVLNSDREMRKRTWSALRGRQKFETHLKPNDSISPDKCVRIYFDFDHDSKRVVIGWVGRHPE